MKNYTFILQIEKTIKADTFESALKALKEIKQTIPYDVKFVTYNVDNV